MNSSKWGSERLRNLPTFMLQPVVMLVFQRNSTLLLVCFSGKASVVQAGQVSCTGTHEAKSRRTLVLSIHMLLRGHHIPWAGHLLCVLFYLVTSSSCLLFPSVSFPFILPLCILCISVSPPFANVPYSGMCFCWCFLPGVHEYCKYQLTLIPYSNPMKHTHDWSFYRWGNQSTLLAKVYSAAKGKSQRGGWQPGFIVTLGNSFPTSFSPRLWLSLCLSLAMYSSLILPGHSLDVLSIHLVRKFTLSDSEHWEMTLGIEMIFWGMYLRWN